MLKSAGEQGEGRRERGLEPSFGNLKIHDWADKPTKAQLPPAKTLSQ